MTRVLFGADVPFAFGRRDRRFEGEDFRDVPRIPRACVVPVFSAVLSDAMPGLVTAEGSAIPIGSVVAEADEADRLRARRAGWKAAGAEDRIAFWRFTVSPCLDEPEIFVLESPAPTR